MSDNDWENKIDEIRSLKDVFLDDIQHCSNTKEIEQVRIKYLSKKGLLNQNFTLLGEAPQQVRPKLGKELNQLQRDFTNLITEKTTQFTEIEQKREQIDITLPGVVPLMGSKHPITQTLDKIKEVFAEMGFVVEEGPEIESDYYNFEALNIPADHPARDMHDTFYVHNNYLLRTHTSPVQIRVMESKKPPVRMIAPGKCFRKDTPDASHFPVFHQVEGLCVDEDISFADLKGVLTIFAKKMFGEEIKIRFRPSYFPFTEPSAEYDFSCIICKGAGCKTCKGSGWLEISGAGMVDPNVYGFVDYDSEKYTGYAFGMGVERIAMIKYGIDDIRLFYENDLRFLSQF